MATWAFPKASSFVSPWGKHPGKAGTVTLHPQPPGSIRLGTFAPSLPPESRSRSSSRVMPHVRNPMRPAALHQPYDPLPAELPGAADRMPDTPLMCPVCLKCRYMVGSETPRRAATSHALSVRASCFLDIMI